ncbi:receptor-like protein EIX2 [Silene latifolia]|uniref:receptor-like protein EIX2 n=1 Tax=Silene latifolia TaxID=37657 RepID=UPI003D77109C
MESERDALVEFKRGIRIDRCGLLDSWGITQDCCMWHGIQCHNHSGHVTALSLPTLINYTSDMLLPCLQGTIGESILGLKQLKYIDLSHNDFGGKLPKFIGSLSNLEYLNLSYVRFTGVIPQEIGNLSKLTYLGLNGNYMRVENLRWLSQLRLLREVELGGNDLSLATNSWLSSVNNLPFLQVLGLNNCNLSLKLSSSLSYINSSTTLGTITLQGNNLNDTSIFEWLSNLNGLETSLTYLDLSFNNHLFESNFQGTGYAMNLLGNLCSLQSLLLYNTSLNYNFLHIIESLSLCTYKSLENLDLAVNQVWGSIPDNIGNLSYLREFNIDNNQLNGTISEALGGLSMLDTLGLSGNSLKGVFTSAHLSNLSNLSSLNLALNTELVVNISANWVPPFQLDILSLESCKVGPDFPKKLNHYYYIQH